MPLPTIRDDAARMRIRGFVTPARATGRPVACRCPRTSETVAVGLVCIMIAQAPATCGVAIDVPLNTAKPPPGTDELIEPPGAMSSTRLLMFENEETASFLSVEPTVIAVEMQP